MPEVTTLTEAICLSEEKAETKQSLELPERAAGLALAGGLDVAHLGKGMLSGLRGIPESQMCFS